jgi:acetolactate synthase I/II/III large subunit
MKPQNKMKQPTRAEIIEGNESKLFPDLEDGTGDALLTRTLLEWGIENEYGVNGGGKIQKAKYRIPFKDLSQANDGTPKLLNLPEHEAGFAPIGSYLTTGKMSTSSATTGAAGLKQCEGLYGAFLHSIPGIYQFATSKNASRFRGPLQDMTAEGGNIISIVRSIIGKRRCLVLDKTPDDLEDILWKAQEILNEPSPVAIVYDPSVLSDKTSRDITVSWKKPNAIINKKHIERFIQKFPKEIDGKRAIIYVGEEAIRYPGIQAKITEFSEMLQAPIVYSLNSFNAVSPSARLASGFIHLGFNDYAMELWKSLNKDKDVVVCIGFDPGEYEMNQANIAANVWHFTNYFRPYGSRGNSFSHRVDGEYRKLEGDLLLLLDEAIANLKGKIGIRTHYEVPKNLNYEEPQKPSQNNVDYAEFVSRFLENIRGNTVFIPDVCQAYKDTQRVLQRPSSDFRMFSEHRGSDMGFSLGMGIGAKLADPELDIHIVTGDGCFAYMSGSFRDCQNLGLTVWVLNNRMYHIVGKGLEVVMPAVDKTRYHSDLNPVDFSVVGRGYNWDSFVLMPDFSNLPEIMDRKGSNVSRLVEVKIDGSIVIGENPRLHGLRHGKTFL